MKSEKEILLSYFGDLPNLNRDTLNHFSDIPPLFFKRFQSMFNLRVYSRYNVLDDDTIKDVIKHNKYNCDLTTTVIYKDIDEKFVSNYLDFLVKHQYLDLVFIYHKFSENFLDYLLSLKNQYINNILAQYGNLSENLIEKYKSQINFILLSENKNLTKSIIDKYNEKLNMPVLINIVPLDLINDNILNSFLEKQTLSSIGFSCLDLPEKYFEQYKSKIEWNYFSAYKKTKVSKDFILKNKDKINWTLFNNFHIIDDENFFQENIINFNSFHISNYPNLSENFIHNNANLLHWDLILKNKTFDNDFLKMHAKYIGTSSVRWLGKKENFDFVINHTDNFRFISMFRFLPEYFIRDNYKKLNICDVLCYNKLSESFLRRMKNVFPVYYVLKYQKISKELSNYLEINALT